MRPKKASGRQWIRILPHTWIRKKTSKTTMKKKKSFVTSVISQSGRYVWYGKGRRVRYWPTTTTRTTRQRWILIPSKWMLYKNIRHKNGHHDRVWVRVWLHDSPNDRWRGTSNVISPILLDSAAMIGIFKTKPRDPSSSTTKNRTNKQKNRIKPLKNNASWFSVE